ncbi:MAG: MFS transporter [Verrucomicrobiota bacterium]
MWLLGGDFALVFFESIFSRFIPLYLKELQASNFMIGVTTGSIAGIVNFFFLPGISRWSDRYRSKLGRRIPFLLWTAPITTVSLILIGFAPEIGKWIHTTITSPFIPKLSQTSVILGLLCLLVVIFHFFNMVLVNAFNWLVRDVVPHDIIGRFLSWFRIVGTLSTCLFLWYVFPYVLDHRKEVCVGVGVLYTIIFLVMCFKIKEEEYLPPEEIPVQSTLKSFGRYFNECLRTPMYRNFFIANTLTIAAIASSGPFLMLFSKETLGLEMNTIGQIFAWGSLATAVFYFGIGWVCDRSNPILVSIYGALGSSFSMIVAYFWVHEERGWLFFSIVSTLPTVAWGLGSVTTAIFIFPKEKFGQFSSGMNVFGYGALIFFNSVIGQVIDLSSGNYRLILAWSFILFFLAFIFMMRVFRSWKSMHSPLATPSSDQQNDLSLPTEDLSCASKLQKPA